MGAVIFAGSAAGVGVAVVVLFALWLLRRKRSWVKDDDLMDLADSLSKPRTRMPVEPTAEARAGGAPVRMPKYHEEV